MALKSEKPKTAAARKPANRRSSAKKTVTEKQTPEITMPEPQTVTAKVYGVDPGETPVFVHPGEPEPGPGGQDPEKPKKLSIEDRLQRIETALLRATGVNVEDHWH